jgi:hypothetical protein
MTAVVEPEFIPLWSRDKPLLDARFRGRDKRCL